MKIKKIINTIVVIIIIGAICFLGYMYILSTKILSDKSGYFEVTTPMNYKFAENMAREQSGHDFAVYDKGSEIYMWGNSYQLNEQDIKEYIEQNKTKVMGERSGYEVSEIKQYELNGYGAWEYTLVYKDNNNIEYYMREIWIKAEKGIYNIEIECPKEKFQKNVKGIEKIVNSFRER